MKRALMVGAMFVIFAAAAFAADSKTDYDHSVNFEKYYTFAWKTPRTSSAGIVDNSIVGSRIQDAVNKRLVQKGMRENDQNPDVYLVVHVGAKNMQDIDYLPGLGGWRHWRWMGPDVVVDRYVEGTVIIDMVDARTNRLVWRSITTDTGSSLVDVQSPKKVDKMVADAFKHFPPTA